MKKQFYILGILIACFATSCGYDNELTKSIFIEDPAAPGLPKYSELGYNTFGAYYDREVFRPGMIVPVKIINTEGKVSFILNGRYMGDEMSMTLTLDDFGVAEYTDLLALHNTAIDLTDTNYSVRIKTYYLDATAQVLNGNFNFKRAQNVYVDNVLKEIVLSGTFQFQALVNGQPITVSDGRFDLGVGADNFYVY